MSITPQEFNQIMEKSGPRMMSLIKKTFRKLGLKIEKEAKLNATIYPRVRTGRLRSSINSSLINFQGSPRLLVQAGNSSAVNYARAVEFGTSDPNPPRLFFDKDTKSFKLARKGIKPRLFMGLAVEKERKNLPAFIRKVMKLSLEGK